MGEMNKMPLYTITGEDGTIIAIECDVAGVKAAPMAIFASEEQALDVAANIEIVGGIKTLVTPITNAFYRAMRNFETNTTEEEVADTEAAS
jgi:hypothetical protein